jgi:hypothetical protein
MPSLVMRTFGKENLSMTESGQLVRHGERGQPCLMRSRAGPEYMREPGNVSMECSLVRECAARHVWQEGIQDKPPPLPLLHRTLPG